MFFPSKLFVPQKVHTYVYCLSKYLTRDWQSYKLNLLLNSKKSNTNFCTSNLNLLPILTKIDELQKKTLINTFTLHHLIVIFDQKNACMDHSFARGKRQIKYIYFDDKILELFLLFYSALVRLSQLQLF